MTHFAYFIGGPLDLTKQAVETPNLRRVFPEMPRSYETGYEATRANFNLIGHVYERRYVHPAGIAVYFYSGVETC